MIVCSVSGVRALAEGNDVIERLRTKDVEGVEGREEDKDKGERKEKDRIPPQLKMQDNSHFLLTSLIFFHLIRSFISKSLFSISMISG